MRYWLPIFTLLLISTTLAAQQFHANLSTVDSCANFLVLDQSVPVPFNASGSYFFVIQHRGAQISTENDATFGSLTDLNGAGRYELNRISSVSGDTIFAQFKIRHDYLTTGNATAITISPDQSAAITTPQAATPYDGNVGGVLLLASSAALEIAADLDASGAGFAGGQESIRNSQCNFLTGASAYTYDTGNWRGTFRGDGIADPSQFSGQFIGRGPALNGGGGGNDHNSGGGGGGHLSPGGAGGRNLEPGLFNCNGNFPGLGGRSLPPAANGSQRVYLGGGGGAGHGNNPNPTAGGAGGGIIIIAAPSVSFVGDPILSARGAAAATVGGDGGGGGGAGGTILLMTDQTSGPATMILNGGDGGDVQNNGQNRCFGPGGGGAGGRLLHSTSSSFDWAISIAGGIGGESLNSTACNPGENVADNGGTGTIDTSVQDPISVPTALGYPTLAVVAPPACPGGNLTIGRAENPVCLATQWYLATPNAFVSLAGNADYGPTNQPTLEILNLPSTPDTIEYRLERYGRDGQILAVLNVLVPVAATPVADFSFVTDGLGVDFTNLSSDFTNQQWFFGDGSTSAELDPQHGYFASQNYPVTLVVSNACGSDSLTQIVTVQATAPVLILDENSSQLCQGDTLKLSVATENTQQLDWSGTGLQFTSPGVGDTVCVVATASGVFPYQVCGSNPDTSLCVTGSITVTDPPDYNVVTDVDVNVLSGVATGTGADSLRWILSTGDTLTGPSVTSGPLLPGDYSLVFRAENGICPDQIDTISFTVFPPTVVNIGRSAGQGCSPFTVQFYNQSSGPIDSILWTNEVAMPLQSRADTLTLTFVDPGDYTVTLTVFTPNGPAQETSTVTVLPSPTVGFTLAEQDGLLTTTNLSTGATSYQWNFGDGNTSPEFEPTHQYAAPDTYEVTLNAFNQGCSRASSQTVLVDMISSVRTLAEWGVTVFPNPARDHLRIEGRLDGWQLFSPRGRLLQAGSDSDQSHLDLRDLPPATYLLRLRRDGKTVSWPIVKH